MSDKTSPTTESREGQGHTPRPWEIDGDLILGPVGSGDDCTRVDGPHAVICTGESSSHWEYDAPLLKAAPNLLEALEAIVHSAWTRDKEGRCVVCDCIPAEGCFPHCVLGKGREVCAKATGKEVV
jgi:hypothetical protein